MLIGQYISKLTDKNRISIPKKFREELGETVVIAKWYENCLVMVSTDKWRIFLKRLIGEARIIISPVRDIDRFIMASAFEVNLDSQGRFVIPENLISYANITSEVVFVGLGDRVEVWSADAWRGIEEIAQQKASLAIERIAKEEGRKDDQR